MTRFHKVFVGAAALLALGVAGAQAQTKIKSNQFGSATSLSSQKALPAKTQPSQNIVNSKVLSNQKIVAGGAGNIVAGGAGNLKNGKIVAGGAGNIVAGGAGNVRR